MPAGEQLRRTVKLPVPTFTQLIINFYIPRISRIFIGTFLKDKTVEQIKASDQNFSIFVLVVSLPR